MSRTQTREGLKRTLVKPEAPDDVPQLFRLNIEVSDLDAAISFYTNLLGIHGRKQAGHRCYFECGPVPLQVARRLLERSAAPGRKGSVLHGREPGGNVPPCEGAELSVTRGRARCTGWWHRGAPVGRAIVLCRGSVGKSPVFRRRGNCLHG